MTQVELGIQHYIYYIYTYIYINYKNSDNHNMCMWMNRERMTVLKSEGFMSAVITVSGQPIH